MSLRDVIAYRDRTRRFVAVGAVLIIAMSLLTWRLGETARADHQPADKIAVSGSAMEVAGPFTDAVLLSSTLKTSSPTDLLIQVTLECAIFTDTSVQVANGKHSKAEATSRAEVWVTLDGVPVPVSTDDAGSAPADISLDDDVPPQAAAARVVFCHRTQGLEADFSDETALESDENFIRLYQGTRDANAFNWVTLDVGSGTHTIEVHAQIVDDTSTSDSDATAAAKAAIGKRTLIVEPAKLANDATI